MPDTSSLLTRCSHLLTPTTSHHPDLKNEANCTVLAHGCWRICPLQLTPLPKILVWCWGHPGLHQDVAHLCDSVIWPPKSCCPEPQVTSHPLCQGVQKTQQICPRAASTSIYQRNALQGKTRVLPSPKNSHLSLLASKAIPCNDFSAAGKLLVFIKINRWLTAEITEQLETKTSWSPLNTININNILCYNWY